MAFIFITKADGTQNKYRLPNNPNIRVEIGRNEDCLISLPDAAGVSGLHCSIAYVDGYYQIKDEGSSNGTFVDGAQLQLEYLRENTQYYLGDCILTFYAEAAAPAPAETPVYAEPAPAAVPPEAAPNVDVILRAESSPKAAQRLAPKAKGGKLKRRNVLGTGKIARPRATENGVSPLYIVLVLIFSFVAGMTIRHWQDTGTFLPKELFASAPADAHKAPKAHSKTK